MTSSSIYIVMACCEGDPNWPASWFPTLEEAREWCREYDTRYKAYSAWLKSRYEYVKARADDRDYTLIRALRAEHDALHPKPEFQFADSYIIFHCPSGSIAEEIEELENGI